MYRHWAARFYFLHEENERDHGRDADAENPEIINVSEHGGLPVQVEGDDAVGLTSRFGGAGAVGDEHVRGVGNGAPGIAGFQN